MVFKEVIRPPLWLLSFIYFLFLSLVIAIWAAFNNQIAFIAWVAATIGMIFIAIAARSEISLDDDRLEFVFSEAKK